MKPRITICIDENGGVDLYFNEAGRALFIKELAALDRSNDHFHLAPDEILADVTTQDIPYPGDHTSHAWGKVSLRPDDWDREFFPHVLNEET